MAGAERLIPAEIEAVKAHLRARIVARQVMNGWHADDGLEFSVYGIPIKEYDTEGLQLLVSYFAGERVHATL